MAITADMIKDLRQKTGAGIMDCKGALKESGGDFEAAVKLLREKGLAAVAKRSGREANEGLIESYVHAGGRIGVLLEVNCETDFVARNDDFKSFVRDIAMQVAAMSPQYVSREEIPAEMIASEKEIYKNEAAASGKPENILDKIAEGKLEKLYFEKVCLLDQSWVRDQDKKINDLLVELASKIGENITIRRFIRYELGEER